MMDRRILAALAVTLSLGAGWAARAFTERPPQPPPVCPPPPAASTSVSVSTAPSAPAPSASAIQDVFTDIYKSAAWGKNDAGVGQSGTGSLMKTTLLYRTFLGQFLKDAEIKSVVDAGCGDWEFSKSIDWSGVDYKGYDIVESVIERDKQKYTKPNVHFFVGNVVDDDLPPADLLLVKHVLQHLPTASVEKLIAKQLPKYKHVLLTDSVDPATLSGKNQDIAVGQFRHFDPTRGPYYVKGAKLLTYWDGANMQQVVYVGRDK
jgi:SAM-dependent methyltransferase